MKKTALYTLSIVLLVFCFGNAFSQSPNYDANFFNVQPGNGNGVKFWFSNDYKIHMGCCSAEYQYGPVTGYSIKTNMGSSAGWGWTWGIAGQTPIAALSNQGNMKIAGSLIALGNVGIGTSNPDFALTVNGKIKAEEVRVVVDVPADYVFEKDYKRMPLVELEKYVLENKHLPGVPNAETIKQDGWNVGEMNNKVLEKVEELTLYVIELKKMNDELRSRIQLLENKEK
jgi:hypothetical protein